MSGAGLARSIRAAVDVDAVVALTRDLVRLRSENPPGRETEVVGYLRDLFTGMGMGPGTVVEPRPGRQNLLAATGDGAASGKPVLLINGHLDTVAVRTEGWRYDPLGGEVHDGRLYGRGAADMKGGIAAAIVALQVARSVGPDLPCEVVFHLVADEEAGGEYGTAELLRRGLINADGCVIPEPTGSAVCLAERGLMFARITTHGVPAHGSDPGKGRSAILAAAAIAQVLHGTEFPQTPHPLLGSTTCNVGTIRGGTGPNVVPEECVLHIDRRMVPGDTEHDVVRGLMTRIAALGMTPGQDYDLIVDTVCEPSAIPADHPFVGTVAASHHVMTGRYPDLTGLPFTTDARFMRNDLGIPTLVYGPGDLDLAHTADEYVEVDALLDAAAVYAHLFATFTGTQPLGHGVRRPDRDAVADGVPSLV
jgi:acetylornithine deacetylase/succinyl-diaminopimelate desuccinylase family protein